MTLDVINKWNSNLFLHPYILNYLINDRHLKVSTIRQNKIGYCDDGFFKGYITFPILKLGKIISVYGRAFPKSDKKTPHLLSKGFSKTNLYNIDALKLNAVLITEAPIDCLTLMQNGYNAVASFGCSMSTKTASLFKDNICYIIYDKDEPGQLGARQAARNLLKFTKNVHIIDLPGKVEDSIDINSYFINTPNATHRIKFLLKKSEPIEPRVFGNTNPKQKKIIENTIDIVKIGKILFKNYSYKAGGIWVRCPYHSGGKETNSSVWIGGNSNIFTCFGCHITGGTVELVKWKLKVGTDEAIDWLRNTV